MTRPSILTVKCVPCFNLILRKISQLLVCYFIRNNDDMQGCKFRTADELITRMVNFYNNFILSDISSYIVLNQLNI